MAELRKIIKIAAGRAQNDNTLNHTTSYSYGYYLKSCFINKLFCYSGRARRKEYWTFQLVDLAVALTFYIAIRHLSFTSPAVIMARNIVSTLLIVPLLSVSVRRFHDTGLSGWWCLLAVIPVAVPAYLLIKDSDRTENKYGVVPDGKTFGTPWYANLLKWKKATADNVITFETQKPQRKSTKRAA